MIIRLHLFSFIRQHTNQCLYNLTIDATWKTEMFPSKILGQREKTGFKGTDQSKLDAKCLSILKQMNIL